MRRKIYFKAYTNCNTYVCYLAIRNVQKEEATQNQSAFFAKRLWYQIKLSLTEEEDKMDRLIFDLLLLDFEGIAIQYSYLMTSWHVSF